MEFELKFNSDGLRSQETILNTITVYFDLSYFRKIPGIGFKLILMLLYRHSFRDCMLYHVEFIASLQTAFVVCCKRKLSNRPRSVLTSFAEYNGICKFVVVNYELKL
jgi:hypothetical protein